MTGYYTTVDPEWYKKRLVYLALFVTAAFVVLLSRLFFLQIIKGQEYRRLSANNCIRLQHVEPLRGLILDRNGHRLVDNRPAFDLCLVPRDVGDLFEACAKIAALTGHSPDALRSRYDRNRGRHLYRPVPVWQDAGRDILAIIEAHSFDLPGVVMDFKPRRHYLYDSLASHVIGYLGEISRREMESGRYEGYKSGSYVGKCGIEKRYEHLLRGQRGGRQVEVNAKGRLVRVLKKVAAVPGDNIYLTLDFDLQQKMESLLAGRAGAAVAMDPFSGEILAMASSPAFPQNAFVDGMSQKQWRSLVDNPYRPMSNKAVQGEYPPGSVYKIVTTIAGLEEGVIDTDTTVYCPGYYKYGNRIFRCWARGGHGRVNLVDAIARSCDVFFYQVGDKVGVERLAWYAKACGLGRPTECELFAESDGLVPTKEWKRQRLGQPWQNGETLTIAIGQGYNLVTPIQMAVLIAAVANGGTLNRPVLLKRVETAGGDTVREARAENLGSLPAGEATMATLRQGLRQVVNDRHGTAYWAVRSRKFDISGKTGTAQVVASPREGVDPDEIAETHKPHAWFVAYAPSDNPKIAVAVLIEHGEHGSSAAGPVAKGIIEAYLQDDAGQGRVGYTTGAPEGEPKGETDARTLGR